MHEFTALAAHYMSVFAATCQATYASNPHFISLVCGHVPESL